MLLQLVFRDLCYELWCGISAPDARAGLPHVPFLPQQRKAWYIYGLLPPPTVPQYAAILHLGVMCRHVVRLRVSVRSNRRGTISVDNVRL